MSSANASIPTNSSPILRPSSLDSNIIMIFFINKLKSIGDVLAPCLTPF